MSIFVPITDEERAYINGKMYGFNSWSIRIARMEMAMNIHTHPPKCVLDLEPSSDFIEQRLHKKAKLSERVIDFATGRAKWSPSA